MLNRKFSWLAALMALVVFTLSACGTVEDGLLDTEANYTVDISVPYATATPLPDYLNVPDAIVIDEDGNVTLNDASIIEGDFQSAREAENQTDYRSLNVGATGIAVQALQSRLQELGYYDGEISGVFDIGTEAAVKRFEQTYGTMQTGVATQKLQLRLFAATAPAYGSAAYNEAVVSQYAVLRPGAVGSSVYALQQRLKNLGYPIMNLTGAFDAQTALCVRMFYASCGIAASDVADVNMQRRLYSEDAPLYDAKLLTQVMATAQPFEVGEGEVSDDTTILGRGNEGDDVREVQQQLIRLGFMAEGTDSGAFDSVTAAAVDRFLASIGQETTGTLTPEARKLLAASAPAATPEAVVYESLNPGDSGEAVMNLQRRLVELGYANGNPNGKYGNATISAVQLFQALNGMEVDGLASAWLQSVLYADDARTYQELQGELPEASVEPTPQPTPVSDMLYFNLSLGSNGNAVLELQNRLVELGYTLTPNGSYDDATRLAVAAFQTAIGVNANGEASASLQRYIRSKAAPGPTVRFYNVPQSFVELNPGDTGDNVTRLQQQLFSLNLLKREDVQDNIGAYNDATRQAVVNAQVAMGYDSPDGIAGVEFQSFLYSRYAKKIKQG